MTFNYNFFNPSQLDNVQNEARKQLQEAQEDLKNIRKAGATPDQISRMQEGITRIQTNLNHIEQAINYRPPSYSRAS